MPEGAGVLCTPGDWKMPQEVLGERTPEGMQLWMEWINYKGRHALENAACLHTVGFFRVIVLRLRKLLWHKEKKYGNRDTIMKMHDLFKRNIK